MAEISTGKPPHYDIEYDEELAIQICNGLRPEFAKNTPECYIKLANKCMDADSSNRSTASVIYYELNKWHSIVNNCTAKDKDELAILKAFQSADVVIPKLSTELSICPKDKLTTSKSIEFSDIPTVMMMSR
ncbi:hypothetical protein C2G38_2033092 [Gigaspora rosea]|uniref:Serine-threonine/tyrosine-protein kinase catalytic domain-containing protein n=1 Tax=Gigaspora rosea TaxID=44941 RepID=A0A397VMD3_9GLOM|nr:hypothetical protein C2G38_2033092 [Gigaspora rosea]